ncbi:MAG: high-potential iron-sulfur protein [Myxococcota bacterium]|nr:high-potential iron-sulfur protein [Myxococcota bacterium]
MRSRREFLKASALVLPAAPALLAGALSGCGSSEQASPPAAKPDPKPMPAPEPPPPAAPPPPSPAPPASAGDAAGKHVTDIPANATLVSSLQYVGQSVKPEERCANCQLYSAGEGELGKCQLFQQGLVKSTGWCASWVKKVG